MICIFRNKLLNIRPIADDFFVVVCLFVRPKVCGCAHAARSWHKRSRGKSKHDALAAFGLGKMFRGQSTRWPYMCLSAKAASFCNC